MGRRCRDVGAALVIDATQSVGALDLDVASVQPDALLCSTYKWLLGPYSLSLAYFGPRFDDGSPVEETWIAREGSRDGMGDGLFRPGHLPDPRGRLLRLSKVREPVAPWEGIWSGRPATCTGPRRYDRC